MESLIFHEKFMLLQKFMTFLKFFMFSIVVISVIIVFVLFINEPSHNYIYLENKENIDISKYLSNENIEVTQKKNEANLLVYIHKKNNQVVIDIRDHGDSSEKSINLKNKLMDSLESFKNNLISVNAEKYNLDKSILEPIQINYKAAEKNKNKETLASYIILFFYVMVAFTFFMFGTGVVEERKSNSFYSVLLSGLPNSKIVIILFFFRVIFTTTITTFIASLFIFFIGTWYQALCVFIFVTMNLSLFYCVALVYSFVSSSEYLMSIVTLILNFIFYTGAILNSDNWLLNTPVYFGVNVLRKVVYNDPINYLYLNSILYIVIYCILIFTGTRLIKSEKVLRAKIV